MYSFLSLFKQVLIHIQTCPSLEGPVWVGGGFLSLSAGLWGMVVGTKMEQSLLVRPCRLGTDGSQRNTAKFAKRIKKIGTAA